MERNILQIEPLLLDDYNGCPFVAMQPSGSSVKMFLIDTGSRVSVTSPQEAEDWGVAVMPITEKDSRLPGALGHFYVDLIALNGALLPDVKFVVQDTIHQGIVGLEFLYTFQCTLSLHPEFPELIIRQPNHTQVVAKSKAPQLRTDYLVCGHEREVVLDTGATSFMTTGSEVAEELGIHLRPLEDPFEIWGAFGAEQILFGAEVSVRRGTTEKTGRMYLLDNVYGDDIILGMEFLLGARFRFQVLEGEFRWSVEFPEGNEC